MILNGQSVGVLTVYCALNTLQGGYVRITSLIIIILLLCTFITYYMYIAGLHNVSIIQFYHTVDDIE